MQTYRVKKGEIVMSDTDHIVLQNEVSAEPIQFVIQDSINDYKNLTYQLQYYQSNTNSGIEPLSAEFKDDLIYLTWYPSGEFSKKDGLMKIQLVGFKANSGRIVIRWSTVAKQLYLLKDYPHDTDTSSEIYSDFISNYLGETNADT